MAMQIAALPDELRHQVISSLTDEHCRALKYDWRFWARPKQLAPCGDEEWLTEGSYRGADWFIWIINAGRGFGKTRSGTGWFDERARAERREMALIAKTPADARDFCIEGPGGILRNTDPTDRPFYEPSKKRLTWRNGTVATIFSSEEPDQLRGFTGDTAWMDEFAKYDDPEAVLTNLLFGMRECSTDIPRIAVTTTPRPKVLKLLRKYPRVVEVRGSSYENKDNLDKTWFENVIETIKGTRLGRQEVFAEELEDTPGALWSLTLIDQHRRPAVNWQDMDKVVVGVDPMAKTLKGARDIDFDNIQQRATGIVVAGCRVEADGARHAYVFADNSKYGKPDEWAQEVVDAYHKYGANIVVAETNNGGDMVETVIKAKDKTIPIKQVWAARGKHTRAEPVSTKYEQGLVHHAGTFMDMEDEMTTWVPGEPSPNRMDALVWAMTELLGGDLINLQGAAIVVSDQETVHGPWDHDKYGGLL